MRKLNKLAICVKSALLIGAVSSFSTFAVDDVEKVEKEIEEVEKIEVTGSRIKRVDLETVSPIVVIDIEEMRDKGFSTAYDALKDLTSASGTVQGAEFGAQGGFTPNAQTVSLRGLGTNQTLVLINGRRMADYPRPYNGSSNFVNLSTIPFAAIKRIEVVTGGASAVYGSDAVAGVMNIITKTDVNDTTINYLRSGATEGGGAQNRLQVITGTSGDNYTLTAAIEYHTQDPVFASERDWLDSVDDGPSGHDYLDRAILKFDPFTDTYRDPGEQACTDSKSGFDYAFREERGYYCGGDFSGQRTLRNERDTISGYVNGTYQLGNNTELFADVLFSSQDSLVRSGNHWVGEYVLELAGPEGGNYGDLDYVLKQRQFNQHELGWKDSSFEETSVFINVGAKGTLFDDYDYEFVLSRSEATSDSKRDWFKEEEVFPLFFGTGSYGFDLPDGTGTFGLYDPVDSSLLDQLVGEQQIVSDSYSNNISFVLSGSAFELPAGEAFFAVVAEWNKQGYTLTPDERTLNTEGEGWYNLTGTGGGGDRSRYAVGFELDVPVLDNFNVKFAGRYDKYDDDTTEVGGRFTPQIGFTYNPSDDILLRANWGKSFRAPDMHRVFAENSGYYSPSRDWIKCEIDYDGDGEFQPNSDFCDATSIRGFSAGSKTLKEEEGDNYGVGIVWDITEEFNISLDWYKIELEQIVVSESVQGLLDDAYNCKFGLEDRDPNGSFCAQVDSQISRTGADDIDPGQLDTVNTSSINAAEHSIEGIDASIGYQIETEYGDFEARLGWSHVLKMVYKSTNEDTNENDRDKAWNDDARSIVNGAISWTMDDMSLVLSGRRIGSIPAYEQPVEYSDEDHENYGNVDRLNPHITFNLTGSYNFTEDLSVNLQVVNLLNERAPKDPSHDSWPYYNSLQYGGVAIGREVGVEVRYTF
ncbi:MAG: TonB-dependent receptor [Colwellia sp.]